MKTFVQSLLAVSMLSIGTALAQANGLESPHNYKRPAVQQKQAPEAGLIVKKGDFQNNMSSVHNYKRQGSFNHAPESSLVLNVPTLKAPVLNPLWSASNYKVYFRPIRNREELAQRKPRQSESQRDSTK